MMRDATIVMRCDGGPVIGMGHVVRCMALAAALRVRGARVLFAMQDGAALVRSAGFEVLDLPATPGRLLPSSDVAVLQHAAQVHAAALVLVDHYGATSEYLAQLRSADARVGVLDDLADRDLSAADWILNQNPFAERLIYRVLGNAIVLRGLEYALLRDQFSDARKGLVRDFDDDGRVLITLGGSAVCDKCAALVEALAAIDRSLDVRVILGRTGAECVVDAAKRTHHDVALLHDVRGMAEQMAWASVALNAGGSTCWEMCCLGVPMVLTGLSADQAENLPALDTAGVAVETGTWDGDGPRRMTAALADLLADPKRRAKMSHRGMALVDGRGALRAADSLLDVAGRVRGRAGAVEVGR